MNKFFYTLICLSSMILKAQTTVFKKIAQRHDVFTSAAWQGVDSFRWQYNADAFLTQLTALKEDASFNWNNLYRYTYTLNVDDKVTVQIRENWTAGNWVNSTRYTNDYDASGNLITVHYDVWSSGVWNVTGKIEYAGYNAQHNYASETALIWSGGNWNYLSKDVYQYYANGYLAQTIEKYDWNTTYLQWDSLERLYFTYNQDSISSKTRSIPNNGGWLQDSKEIFTFSTTPFVRTQYLTQVWDTTANPDVWVNNKRIIYTYNTFDSLDKTTSDIYNAGSWTSQARSQYSYNGSNQKTECYTELYSGGWANDFRQTFAYTGSNMTEEIQYAGLGTGWEEVKRLDYIFDINNLNTFRQIDTFNGVIFAPNNRDFYYYNSFTVNTTNVIATIQHSLLYPNPAKEAMTLSVSSTSKFNAAIRVNDLMGKCRLIIEQPIFAGENSIPLSVSFLPAGIYMLQLFDNEKGTKLVHTFEVNK